MIYFFALLTLNISKKYFVKIHFDNQLHNEMKNSFVLSKKCYTNTNEYIGYKLCNIDAINHIRSIKLAKPVLHGNKHIKLNCNLKLC